MIAPKTLDEAIASILRYNATLNFCKTKDIIESY